MTSVVLDERHLEEWAASQGFTQVVLTTGSVMAPARALYLAAGYELYDSRTLGTPKPGVPPEQVAQSHNIHSAYINIVCSTIAQITLCAVPASSRN